MFTGLIEEIGTIRDRTDVDGAARLTVAAEIVLDDVALGDSIAVSGVCLTVAEILDGAFLADVMPESLARTTLGELTAGSRVNLERAVQVGSRLGGHIVQGHVDGVGQVASRTPGARWDDVVINVPGGITRYIVEKGSITIDGVSLTVTQVDDTSFGVSLIPTTLTETTLGELAPGSPVNLEVDVVAKYIERLIGDRS
jgi:riboflavin synthase